VRVGDWAEYAAPLETCTCEEYGVPVSAREWLATPIVSSNVCRQHTPN
jgi:hypothetical protein